LINFSPKYGHHSLSKGNNQKNNIKTNEHSGTSEEKIRIERLKKEKETKEKEIRYKDQIIKEQEKIIKLLKQNEAQLKEQIKIIKKRYDELKENCKKILEENKILKNKIIENENNINNLKEKEIKLMRMLYLIKEQGIDINTILNEVKNESNNESINKSEIIDKNNDNTLSSLTVYFPDKVNMKNIMELKEVEKVPAIDFNNLPEYSFQSEEEKQNNFEEIHNQEDFDLNVRGFNNYGVYGLHRNSA
jgi:septal ring factor EnvC (AmiA/AmiB activator)